MQVLSASTIERVVLLLTGVLFTLATVAVQAAPPSSGRTALTADLVRQPVTIDDQIVYFVGRGDAHYNVLNSQGSGTTTYFNANARFSLIHEQNIEYLGLTEETAADAVVMLMVGWDDEGDGCGPDDVYAACAMVFGEIEVNDAGVVHATYKLALRIDSTGKIKGDGLCFDPVTGAEVFPEVELGHSAGVFVNGVGMDPTAPQPLLFGYFGQ